MKLFTVLRYCLIVFVKNWERAYTLNRIIFEKGKRLDFIKTLICTRNQNLFKGDLIGDIDNYYLRLVDSKNNRAYKRSGRDWNLRDTVSHKSLTNDFVSSLYHIEEQMCAFVNKF